MKIEQGLSAASSGAPTTEKHPVSQPVPSNSNTEFVELPRPSSSPGPSGHGPPPTSATTGRQLDESAYNKLFKLIKRMQYRTRKRGRKIRGGRDGRGGDRRRSGGGQEPWIYVNHNYHYCYEPGLRATREAGEGLLPQEYGFKIGNLC